MYGLHGTGHVRMRRTSILGWSMPSMSSPEPGQCSTSLMPGSCGWMLVNAVPEVASHTRTTCRSALSTLRPPPPGPAHTHRGYCLCLCRLCQHVCLASVAGAGYEAAVRSMLGYAV